MDRQVGCKLQCIFFFLFCTYSDNGRRNTFKFLEAYKNSLKRKCLTEPSIVDFMVSDLVGCMMIHFFSKFRSYTFVKVHILEPTWAGLPHFCLAKKNMGRSFLTGTQDKQKRKKK